MRHQIHRIASRAGVVVMMLVSAFAATPGTAIGQSAAGRAMVSRAAIGRAAVGRAAIGESVVAQDGAAAVDVSACPDLDVPGEFKLALRAYARGVQIYRWDGAKWVFVAPEARLYADQSGLVMIGRHYAGPTWEFATGYKVAGSVQTRCTPDPTAIPWLLLQGVGIPGPRAEGVPTYIQRLATVGGLAPSSPGTRLGQLARVPYTAEYAFYALRDGVEL